MTFSFRPHHFLCTLGFQGKGYSPHFIENYEAIASALCQDEDLPIRVVPQGDSICSACPHQHKTGCAQENKIRVLDYNHSKILNIQSGDVLTWRQAKARLKHHMTLDAFHHACATCEWKSLGLCEKALNSLRGENEKKTLS